MATARRSSDPREPGDPRPTRRTAVQRVGDAAETHVADRLTAAGWTVVGRNLRIGRNEVDLLAVDPGPPVCLVLVEVRWRGRRDFGVPEETFDHRKRGHLRAALGRLLELDRLPDGRPLPGGRLRVDLVVVEPSVRPDGAPRLRHHRDALGG